MRENADQNNSEYGHFLRSFKDLYYFIEPEEYWHQGIIAGNILC